MMKKLFVALIIITALSIFGTGVFPQPIEGAGIASPAPKVTPNPQTVAADIHDKADEVICTESMPVRTVIEEVSVPMAELKMDAP